MTSKEVIKQLMTDKNMTNASMASAIGITQAALWDRLNPKKTDNMTVKKLNSMLRILGYEIAVVPRTKANRIEGAYIIDDCDS